MHDLALRWKRRVYKIECNLIFEKGFHLILDKQEKLPLKSPVVLGPLVLKPAYHWHSHWGEPKSETQEQPR